MCLKMKIRLSNRKGISMNYIPIAELSRTIEIDLRDMLDENNLPEPLTPAKNILM